MWFQELCRKRGHVGTRKERTECIRTAGSELGREVVAGDKARAEGGGLGMESAG